MSLPKIRQKTIVELYRYQRRLRAQLNDHTNAAQFRVHPLPKVPRRMTQTRSRLHLECATYNSHKYVQEAILHTPSLPLRCISHFVPLQNVSKSSTMRCGSKVKHSSGVMKGSLF